VFKQQAVRLLTATMLTAAVGVPLILAIEKGVEESGYLVKDASGQVPKAEVELLFGNLALVAGGLAAAGVLILIAGLAERGSARNREIGIQESVWIGAVQGLCLPFRGFSRSGATISTGLLLGALKTRVEEFSFALAVILTPAAVGRMVLRVVKYRHEAGADINWSLFAPSLIGMACAFLAGLLALKWLSHWLERGRWHLFGVYCLLAAATVLVLHWYGF
jgi:undecaprenyl-diphosphatase